MFEIFLFLVATWFGQLRGGPLRYLGFASSRAAEIYGDLARIYGASPQFFATVSSSSFDCTEDKTCRPVESMSLGIMSESGVEGPGA